MWRGFGGVCLFLERLLDVDAESLLNVQLVVVSKPPPAAVWPAAYFCNTDALEDSSGGALEIIHPFYTSDG